MHLSLKPGLKLIKAHNRAVRRLLSAVILASVFLSACQAGKTSTAEKTPVYTPTAANVPVNAAPASTTKPTNPPAPTASIEVVASPTPTSPAVLADTATIMPTAGATPTPTSLAAVPTPGIPAIFFPPIQPFYYNMAADIQNNVNGVLGVLNVSGENGEAYIIIREAYIDKSFQYNASYNIVKYLSTYFKGLSNLGIAKLFGGTQFTLHIKSLSITDEYIVDTITPYDVLVQVAGAQVDQGQWEALVHAQVQMQYHVTVLCDVKPNTVKANTDTNLVISAWLTYQGKQVIMQYVTAAWKDSTDHQYYCAGDPFDSSCQGHSGSVNSGSTIIVDVTIQAQDGLVYDCQAFYSAP